MDSKDEKYIILEQYRIYSDAKEKFIDRQFTTNKFFLIANVIILVTIYILSTLTPQFQPVIILSVIGLIMSLMWWLNIDSYQTLIKVKYANVIEYLETKLPEQPFHKEFVDYQQVKKKSNFVIFGDFQKTLAVLIAGVYLFSCVYSIITMVKFQML